MSKRARTPRGRHGRKLPSVDDLPNQAAVAALQFGAKQAMDDITTGMDTTKPGLVFSLERTRAAERAERERARIETERRFAALERMCGLAEEVDDQMDPIFSWAQSHPDDTRRLRDHFVAVSSTNDLVDHDVSFEQLYARVLHRKDVVVGRLTFDGASQVADPA